MNKVTTLGIDLAKTVFQLHGVDLTGKVVWRREVRRAQLTKIVAQLEPCLIGIEACGGANYWARRFAEFGHQVKMMSPQFVKPYRKSDKNDRNDAEAICEAVTRPSMRFVAVKSVEQQDMLTMHRAREGLMKERVALINRIRGSLCERRQRSRSRLRVFVAVGRRVAQCRRCTQAWSSVLLLLRLLRRILSGDHVEGLILCTPDGCQGEQRQVQPEVCEPQQQKRGRKTQCDSSHPVESGLQISSDLLSLGQHEGFDQQRQQRQEDAIRLARDGE